MDPAPVCALCRRVGVPLTVHHLVPRSRGRRKGLRSHELPTAELCPDCHRQLHVLYENAELELRLASIAALREEPAVQRFLSWLRKQDAGTRIRVRR